MTVSPTTRSNGWIGGRNPETNGCGNANVPVPVSRWGVVRLTCAGDGAPSAGTTVSRFKTKANTKYKDRRYTYDLKTPSRYYRCYGMQREHLRCRERPYIRADRLEELIWNVVKSVVQNPDLIVKGMESMGERQDGGLEKRIAQAERELGKVQKEEDRAIGLYVSGKITEEQLDNQRRLIHERLEAARASLDDHRAPVQCSHCRGMCSV